MFIVALQIKQISNGLRCLHGVGRNQELEGLQYNFYLLVKMISESTDSSGLKRLI